jgi:hypothetical protein
MRQNFRLNPQFLNYRENLSFLKFYLNRRFPHFQRFRVFLGCQSRQPHHRYQYHHHSHQHPQLPQENPQHPH